MSQRCIARFAWPVVLTLGVLTGCAEGGSQGPAAYPYATGDQRTEDPATETAAKPSVAELNALLVQADEAKPYSGTLKLRTELPGGVALTTSGQINFNAPFTGYMQIRTPGAKESEAADVNEVITDRFVYVRKVNRSGAEVGPWERLSRAALGETSAPRLGAYARLLLKQGANAIKGEETQDGVSGMRLSGNIVTEDIRTLEPALYNRLRTENVKDFACDIWVDRSGRTFRLEQWVEMKGIPAHNVMTVSKFRAPITVKVPTNDSPAGRV